MNQFTKEELQYLYESIDNNCECFQEPNIAYDLRDKLKAMLNNNCNHENHKHIVLDEEDFKSLIIGKIISKAGLRIILSDIGYQHMIIAIVESMARISSTKSDK